MLVKSLAAYTHLSSTVSEIQQVIGRKLRHFPTPICLAATQGVTPLEFREDKTKHKTRMNGLSCGEESMTVCSAILIQYQRVTDRQTSSLQLRRASAQLTHVKILKRHQTLTQYRLSQQYEVNTICWSIQFMIPNVLRTMQFIQHVNSNYLTVFLVSSNHHLCLGLQQLPFVTAITQPDTNLCLNQSVQIGHTTN